jgi:hypothetical protein
MMSAMNEQDPNNISYETIAMLWVNSNVSVMSEQESNNIYEHEKNLSDISDEREKQIQTTWVNSESRNDIR